jgi:hypothetical protein
MYHHVNRSLKCVLPHVSRPKFVVSHHRSLRIYWFQDTERRQGHGRRGPQCNARLVWFLTACSMRVHGASSSFAHAFHSSQLF